MDNVRPSDRWRQCGAKNTDGSACRGPALKGGARCRMHGGATPQAMRAAARRVALAELEQGAAEHRYGEPNPAGPVASLEEEIARTRGAITYLHAAIIQMGQEELLSRVSSEHTADSDGKKSITVKIEAVENAWVRLMLRERKHLAELLSLAFRVQLTDRRSAITDDIAGRFNIALTGILRDLGHDEADERVRQVVRDNLRFVAEPITEVAG